MGPDHFRTLRIPLLRGRTFTLADRAGAPRVIILNRAAARRFFPGQDPMGRRVVWDDPALLAVPDSAWEIVGLVDDVTYWPVDEPPGPDFYFPYLQRTYANTFVMARTRVLPATIIRELRAAVASANPDLPMDDLRTMDERVAQVFSGRRFIAYVLAGFAALAFGLAAVGVYGVASYAVSRRVREMGVRLALGAAPHDVFSLVVREGLILGVTGLVLGLAAALAAGRLLGAMLYQVNPGDPVTLVAAAAAVGLAVLLATVVPARRAARVDPIQSLKAE